MHGEDVTFADIDSDGDLDIISSGGWYENDGAANPSFSSQGVVMQLQFMSLI